MLNISPNINKGGQSHFHLLSVLLDPPGLYYGKSASMDPRKAVLALNNSRQVLPCELIKLVNAPAFTSNWKTIRVSSELIICILRMAKWWRVVLHSMSTALISAPSLTRVSKISGKHLCRPDIANRINGVCPASFLASRSAPARRSIMTPMEEENNTAQCTKRRR